MDGGKIKEHMPVIGADGQQLGKVDHLDGGAIKLTKNDSPDGQHHWIPMSWVTQVDEHVHISHSSQDAMREWMASSPQNVTSL